MFYVMNVHKIHSGSVLYLVQCWFLKCQHGFGRKWGWFWAKNRGGFLLLSECRDGFGAICSKNKWGSMEVFK